MTHTENQKKLLKILNEIFQLDQSDLDFGIYRIMNTKSQEINEFLENDLLSSVANAFSSNDNNSIQKKLDEAIQQAKSLGADPETLPKVITLKKQLSSSSTSSTLENDVFSHLANFFKRYYKDGDFVSLRRYKKDTYAIPYEGEEVKLHWANSDQYYIKSGEYFRDYSFKVDDKTIHFKLQEASTEQNNNKGDKRFFIYKNHEALENELNIVFEYKVAKAHVFPENIDLHKWNLDTLAPTEKNKNRTILEKHLKSYVSRNNFDYFIHKDLGGFLSRELDFYIKNEMLFLDDIMDSPIKYEEVMGKIKIFKEVSQKVINFLTQLEELQKKLWEKKKFIIETNYCITLDKIDENYYEEIFACKEQLSEWKELFDVDIQSVDDLKEEKYLVLDTKFFNTKFKYKLLSEFDNLDEDIDGVLINSENFGALNLLQDRYKEQIKTVYIDPPYNTGSDGFLYADNYQHSSWMSFMYDRLAYSRELMSDDALLNLYIDENEHQNSSFVLSSIFGEKNRVSDIIWKNSSKNDQSYISTQHEYILGTVKNKLVNKGNWSEKKEGLDEIYKAFNKFKKEYGSNYKSIHKAALDWYNTFPASNPIRDSKHYSWMDEKGIYFPDNISGPNFGQYRYDVIHPITKKVCKEPSSGWRYPEVTIKQRIIDGLVHFGNDETTVPNNKTYLKNTENQSLTSMKYKDGRVASKLLTSMFNNKVFTNPKDIELSVRLLKAYETTNSIILDFFAGSGTTGHSVINLNREDKGKRKYILVEMGEYFDTVTKPRIQKVIYSDSWKDGKPQTKNGISQIFKYFKLESYEDTLNNLEFKKTPQQQQTLDFHPQVKEDYILNYALDLESKDSLLSIDTFKTPFNYKLKIATSSVGETKETAIDLVETFNYLLGLVVESMNMNDGFLLIKGKNLKNEKILIIWRDNKTSEELNRFVKNIKLDNELDSYDDIYSNGDTNLENVKLIEQAFKRLMLGDYR